MSTTEEERALSRAEAAKVVGLSQDTLRKAIKQTVDTDTMPRLVAKKVGNRTRIKRADLWDWFERLPDA